MRDARGPSPEGASPGDHVAEWLWKIALVGPPGSGKGTQAAWLARALSLAVVSTGGLARKASSEPTDRGSAAHASTSSGALVPDHLICELVGEAVRELSDSARGVVFDGFPRTDVQVHELEAQILRVPLDAYIELRVDEELLLERLSARCRDDDADLTDLRRLDEFDQFTRPMIERLRADGRMFTVDGGQPPASVHRAITEALGRNVHRIVSRSMYEGV